MIIEDDNPWVIHTNKLTIDRLELETWTNTSVVRDMAGAVSVDYHFTKGFIFYSDQTADRVSRMNLSNPSDTVDVITNSLSLADAIAIDWIYDHLYWIDASHDHIMVSELDGTQRKTIISTQLVYPRALIVYPNIGNNSVCRVDKQNGSNFQIIRAKADQPVGIKVYSEDNQPTATNLCFSNNGGCEQLCLPTPQYTVICTCADGFELKADEKTCLYRGSGKWVTFANLNTIERMDLETNVTETIASKTTNAVDLDIHYEKGFVYWSDVRAKKISRSTVTGTSSGDVEDIIVGTVDVPDGIAIDWIYNLLYWTDTGHNHIQVSRLDGTDRKTIIKNDGSLEEPRAIVVDPNTGLLFFTDWGSSSRIERCGMDGRDRRIIINSDIKWPNGLTIGTNVCEISNGGCSHICFPLPTYSSDQSTLSGCMCADFYAMTSDNKTCVTIEPPKDVIIDVRSTSVKVSWNFPVNLDYIVQTEIELYDNDVSIVYTRSTYYPVTKHTITAIQLQKCHRYKIKLRCQYSMHGWSPKVEHTFWATENLVYSDPNKNINITWTAPTDRPSVDVYFDSLVDTQKKIFANENPIDNPQKYRNLNRNGLNIQFTLQEVLISDVGLYKSAPASDITVIDGCALLVITENPKTPYMTYDKQPFVGSTSVFKCSSAVKRHPMYLPRHLQYTWSAVGIKQDNTLSINPITKSDKGKDVSCTVTDDRGKVSASSNTISLDPYYGPESIRLSTDSESVIVTEGSRFIVTCFAICHPKCYFVWKRLSEGVISDITNNQTYTINAVSQNDAGIYSCAVTHQKDTARIGSIEVTIIVHGKSSTEEAKTLRTETTSVDFTSHSSSENVTQIPDEDYNEKNRQTDHGVISKEIIIYPIVGVVLIIGIVVLILVFLRRHHNSTQRTEKPFEEPDKRISTVSAIYDTIDEQRELTTNMYNPNSVYLDPFYELASSRTDPKYVFSDLLHRHGDASISESNVPSNDQTDIETVPKSLNDPNSFQSLSNPIRYGDVDNYWSNENSDNSDYLRPINFNNR
ncbi:Hypothetical predicted protein [Mytilus galloprovincialis]|uniref:Ig-like domain-containing protein n=1 Tax=Mytilus galloprovincialis TaxID=29158 RepID=A0A8B6GBD5_MYTGA|nr:Hypothetical predicted protein [Mytilus galloprovincialis]